MNAPGSPCADKFFGMERFNFTLVSINAFSSKIACRSDVSSPMDLDVFARRNASRFVLAAETWAEFLATELVAAGATAETGDADAAEFFTATTTRPPGGQ